MLRSFAALALLACARAGVVHEPELCCNWATANGPPSEVVRFSVLVREQGLEEIRYIALEVSDPASPKYGRFLSKDEVDAFTAPRGEDVRAVARWLSSLKGARIALGSQSLFNVECGRQEAEALLSTSFRTVGNAVTGQTALRASDFTIPAEVEAAVTAVIGLHGLPLPPKMRQTQSTSEAVAEVTPSVIASTYGVSGVQVSGSAKNRQAVAEFQGQTMNSADLVTVFEQEMPSAKALDAKVSKFVGDVGEGTAQVEASLDIQYIMGAAPGIQTEFWYYKSYAFCSDLKKWTTTMLADEDCPLVHSVSYGWQGDLAQIGCHEAEVQAVDDDFAKLAARGISILFASGDTGSGLSGNKLWPSWPASSPWVTAVGATRFEGQTVGSTEMATDQFGSGGGFSSSFTQMNASWQTAAVKAYLSGSASLEKFPPAGTFAPGGRATPDVSALGEGFQVYVNGQVMSVGGTSASTPLFAGLVSLLNEARMQNGLPQLGFLNKFLYANPGAFTDVVQGTNAINRQGMPFAYGWECTEGWDPATGLGTPIFGKLLAAALASGGKTTSLVV